MGTDIHLGVEQLNGGEWVSVTDALIPSWESDDYPGSRHYRLFAALADVRNGYGFAGVKTHEPVTPWFAGRGLPEGCNFKEEYVEGNWLGDHSFTWATLGELKRAPWDVEFHDTGVVERSVYDAWKASGTLVPSSWCGDVSGPGIVTLDESAYNVVPFSVSEGAKVYIRAHWTWRPLQNCAFRRWVDGLADRFHESSWEDVRVVMGFDS